MISYSGNRRSSPDRVFMSQEKAPLPPPENSSGADGTISAETLPYYSSRSSYFWAIDLAGFKKDRSTSTQSPVAGRDLPWHTFFRIGPGRTALGTEVTPVATSTPQAMKRSCSSTASRLDARRRTSSEYRLRWE